MNWDQKRPWNDWCSFSLIDLNIPRKHIINNTELQLQYDPHQGLEEPWLRETSHHLTPILCVSPSFRVMALLFLPPVSPALPSGLRAHVQQVTCWGPGSFQAPELSVSLPTTAQGVNLAFGFYQLLFAVPIGMDGKAGVSRHPLWFYKVLIVAPAHKVHRLQRWMDFRSLCCFWRRREWLSARVHLTRPSHWSQPDSGVYFCFTLSVFLTGISS